MKKKNLGTYFLITGMAALIGLSSCERRERPLAKTTSTLPAEGASTKISLADPIDTEINAEVDADGNLVCREEDPSAAEDPCDSQDAESQRFLQAVEKIKSIQAQLEEKGYVLDTENRLIDISKPFNDYYLGEEHLEDRAAQVAVACELLHVRTSHENFVRAFSGAAPREVSYDDYSTHIQAADIVIESIDHTMKVENLEDVTMEKVCQYFYKVRGIALPETF